MTRSVGARCPPFGCALARARDLRHHLSFLTACSDSSTSSRRAAFVEDVPRPSLGRPESGMGASESPPPQLWNPKVSELR